MTTTTTASVTTAPSAGDVDLTTTAGYDDEQVRLMEELCIVIDENDKSLRPGTKKECTPPDAFPVFSVYVQSLLPRIPRLATNLS